MKKGIIFQIFLRLFGILILFIGIRMIGEGIYNYINEHTQKDWITIYAEVSDISSEYSRTWSRHGSHSHVSYDITYQYEVDGQEYSGMLYNRVEPMALGEKVKIKYDPNAPEDSNYILSPSIYNMIILLICGSVFTTIGYFMSGTWVLLRKIRRKDQPEEEEKLPPEEYVDPKKIKYASNKWSKNIFVRLLLFVVVLGVILLSHKLFPGKHPVDVEQFQSVVEKKGYITTDTTEKLRQDWRVGSMMKESVSFDDGNVRMDFCVMDTVDSAMSLYVGMTLPVSEGEEITQDGMVQEIHVMESDSMYVVKARFRDTVVYAAALPENKEEVIDILKTLGYWKE